MAVSTLVLGLKTAVRVTFCVTVKVYSGLVDTCRLPSFHATKRALPLGVAVAVSVNIVSVSNIDTMNIYNATRAGMAEVLRHLTPKPQVALADAMEPFVEGVETVPIIKGDALSVSIAAASIVAKVTRDRLMLRLDELFPQYGFAGHKGYGSAKHMAALREHGASEWHRRSFEPVKSLCLEPVPARSNELYSPLLDKDFEYALQ